MPRKSKTVKCEYNKKYRQRVVKNEDSVFIGKENIERWTNLKNKFNFLSDNEFASYLLDLFTNEKSCLQNKPFQKDNTYKQSIIGPEGLASDVDQLESSSPKVLLLQNNTNKVETSSSVIVVNSTLRSDNEKNYEDRETQACHPLIVETSQISHTNDPCLTNTSHESQNVSDAAENVDSSPCSTSENHSAQTNLESTDKFTNADTFVESVSGEKSNEPQVQLGPEATSCGADFKQKKNRKTKANNAKETISLDEEGTLKQKKKKWKCLENKQYGDSTGAVDKVPTPVLGMKSETTDSEVSAEMVEARLKLPEPPCERVAITIKLCGDCELHHVQDACPLRQPIALVADSVSMDEWVAGRVGNDLVKSFAEASLPPCLELKVIDSQHGPSVVAGQNLRAFLQFGPLVGQPIAEREIPDDSTMEHIWELSDSASCRYMTTSDANQSNWLRYVRPAPVRSSRNLEVILRDDQLLFITTTAISAGYELLFWMENFNTAWSHKKLCKTKCGGCNLSFSHTLYYRLHCSVFHDPAYSLTVRKYHCKVCGLSVLGKENIVKHAADKHNGKGAYQCQFCHKFFLRLNYLEVHRTYGCSANPNRARPLCDYCGRKFCQPQKLKVHIKRMHSEMLEVLRDFQCKHCLKILGSRAALQRHFKEVHQKDVVGAFTCDRCGKMFQNKSNLKIHMLTHSGVKPFKCKEADCPAAFTTKQCLQFHYRKIHRLEEGCMPRIERSVEYTFDAYAGSRRPSSVNSDSQCSTDGEDNPPGKYPTEEHSRLSPPISVTNEQVTKAPLDTFNKMVVSKGSKKWMGETAENSRSNVFDFDEDDKEQDINVSQIEDEPVPMLFHHCKQDSANASLLVEAALDAAERDIDITSKVPSPMSLVTNKEVYPVLRAHLSHSPLSLSRPVSPVDYPIQEQSQSPHLAMESCYPTAISPRHPYSLMFPERTPHYEFRLSPPPGQVDTFHLEESRYDLHHRRDENSSDEGINVAQNLSLGLKNKPLQLEIPYKYDALEERSFECGEGLDMSRTSGYHHSFVSMAPRYPHALYEPRTYSHADVLRVVNFSHSVDLSLPRSHHQLTPPMNQSLIEPIRIISPPPPPPPPYQAYPLSTSPYSRPPHSPTYHPYNNTY